MKFLQHIAALVATLAIISSAALADDTSNSPCVPPSTLGTVTSTPESASTTLSTAAQETVTLSSDTAESSTIETVETVETAKTSPETTSDPPASECQSTDTPSSPSTSTAPVPTTSVVVNMPRGQVNATMLEWTVVWRRCNMPATASGFETRKVSTRAGPSVSVSTVEPSASSVV